MAAYFAAADGVKYVKRFLIGLAFVTTLAAPAAASTIVYNGSFEAGAPTKNTFGKTFESLPSGSKWGVWKALNGWTTVNGPGIEVQTSGTIGPLAAQHGSYYVELDSTGNTTMEQQVKLAKGSYLLSFWYSPRTGNAASDQIDYSVGDVVKGSVNGLNALLGKPVNGWQKIVAPFTIGGTRILVVSIEDLLVMKALAGRPQDDQDIRGLVAAQRNVIDWSACLELAEKLGEAVDLDIVSRLRAARVDRP